MKSKTNKQIDTCLEKRNSNQHKKCHWCEFNRHLCICAYVYLCMYVHYDYIYINILRNTLQMGYLQLKKNIKAKT